MTVWYEIKTLDGRTLSRTHEPGFNRWLWIADVIMADADCDLEDIGVEETEDEGDFITVNRKRYATCDRIAS
jgi:hypothetical protein